jgi:hypothetical protein
LLFFSIAIIFGISQRRVPSLNCIIHLLIQPPRCDLTRTCLNPTGNWKVIQSAS